MCVIQKNISVLLLDYRGKANVCKSCGEIGRSYRTAMGLIVLNISVLVGWLHFPYFVPTSDRRV